MGVAAARSQASRRSAWCRGASDRFLSGLTVSTQSGSPLQTPPAANIRAVPICEVDVEAQEMTTVLGSTPTARRTALVVMVAWLLAGTLDITTAVFYYVGPSARAARLLQGIASGLLGALAFDGGAATALLGLA